MKRWIAAGALLFVGSGAARAQFESPLLSKVQLNLVNPGGKSLAMGGAFVSLADDATAALANPSGLPQIRSWQFGASGKGFQFAPTFSTANYFSSGPTASDFSFDSLDTYEFKSSASDLEYASLVGPLARNVSIALYRAVNLRYKLDSGDVSNAGVNRYRAFLFNRGSVEATSLDEFGGVDLRNEVWGASVGGKFGPLSVGAGVTLNKLRYELTAGPSGTHQIVLNADNGSRTGVRDLRNDDDISVSVSSGTKSGWVIGMRYDLWEPARLAIGAVYRHSPTFDVGYSVRAFVPATGQVVADFACGKDDTVHNIAGSRLCGSFRVPDDWSVGVSGNLFAQNLILAVEVQRIRYSQLNDGFVSFLVYKPSTADRSAASGSNEDGTIPHVGLEYTVSSTGLELAFRAGYYREPAHGTRLTLYPDANRDGKADTGSSPSNITDPPLTDAYNVSFDGGQVQNHVSLGVGASVARHLSIDAAYDYSKSTKSFVLSAFYRF